MAEGVEIDLEGFNRKLKSISQMIYFFENIHKDAANWMQENEVNEVLNGQYVNRISGNLRRSQDVVSLSEVTSLVFSDLGIAPYALAVLKRTQARYGRNFFQITIDLFAEEMQALMKKEWERMLEVVNSGDPYKYQNPFPDIQIANP
jgi:hypothetical protein